MLGSSSDKYLIPQKKKGRPDATPFLGGKMRGGDEGRRPGSLFGQV